MPRADYDSKERFACWSRFLDANGIFFNKGWRTNAYRLFAADLDAIAGGDSGALVALLSLLPQALSFPHVRRAIDRALRESDAALFNRIGAALARHPRGRIGAQTERAVEAVHKRAAENPGVSRRAVLIDLTGGQAEDDKEYETLARAYKRFATQVDRSYPRLRACSVRCAEHRERMGSVFDAECPSSRAPALYRGPGDHPPVRRGAPAPGRPLWRPRYSSCRATG